MYQAWMARYQNWGNWASNNFGIKIVAGYEGGYTDDYGGSNNLITAYAKQLSVLQGYTTLNFNNFRGLGALPYTGMSGEFPAVFQLTGEWPSNNAWSVLEDIDQSPAPPQWNAISTCNFLLKRDLDPASNDNDPMWLEKAARPLRISALHASLRRSKKIFD
jgi:hypothetical protein